MDYKWALDAMDIKAHERPVTTINRKRRWDARQVSTISRSVSADTPQMMQEMGAQFDQASTHEILWERVAHGNNSSAGLRKEFLNCY